MAEFNTEDPFAAGVDEEFTQEVPVGSSSGIKLIPDGTYVAKLSDIKKDYSSSGNPMYVMDFTVMGPPEVADAVGWDGRFWASCVPAAMWKTIQTFQALGLQVKEGDTLRFKKSDVLNRGVTITVVKSTYNEQERSKITEVKAHPSGAGYKYEIGGGGEGLSTAKETIAPPASSPAPSQRPKASLPSFKKSSSLADTLN
jgi:hypothetical protein